MFVVGTEEGAIHSCSTSLAGRYQRSFTGHSLAVYGLTWCPHHPGAFLSAGADWSVRLWDAERSQVRGQDSGMGWV